MATFTWYSVKKLPDSINFDREKIKQISILIDFREND